MLVSTNYQRWYNNSPGTVPFITALKIYRHEFDFSIIGTWKNRAQNKIIIAPAIGCSTTFLLSPKAFSDVLGCNA